MHSFSDPECARGEKAISRPAELRTGIKKKKKAAPHARQTVYDRLRACAADSISPSCGLFRFSARQNAIQPLLYSIWNDESPLCIYIFISIGVSTLDASLYEREKSGLRSTHVRRFIRFALGR